VKSEKLLLDKRLHVAVVALLAIIIYIPSLGNGFVELDDPMLLTKNWAVHQLSFRSLLHIFTSYDPELYVPMTMLSYQIENAIFGLSPAVTHITSLLIHAGCSILVYGIIFLLARKPMVAFVCALLFAIHPINTETVAWASARKDVLSGLFFLLSLWLWLIYRNKGNNRFYWGSFGAFLFGLLSKVTIGMLPIMMLLIDWKEHKSTKAKEITPFVLLSIIFGIIALFGKQDYTSILAITDRVLLFFKSCIFVIGKLIFPFNLNVMYLQHDPITIASPEFFVPILITLVILLITFLSLNRTREIVFGITFFLIAFLPSIFTYAKFQHVFFASDRYVYLASIGIFYLIGLAVSRVRVRNISLGIIIFITVIFSSLTMLQVRTWKNSETMYEKVLAVDFNNGLAHNNIGSALMGRFELERAELAFNQSISVDPTNPVPYANLGKLALQDGNEERAAALFQEAIERSKDRSVMGMEDIAAYFFLGELLRNQGNSAAALVLFEEAVSLGYDLAEPHFNLGILYQDMGRPQDAILYYRKAFEIDPLYIPALYNFAKVTAEMGRLTESVEALEKVVSINPDYEQAKLHLENLRRIVYGS